MFEVKQVKVEIKNGLITLKQGEGHPEDEQWVTISEAQWPLIREIIDQGLESMAPEDGGVPNAAK